MSKLDAVYLNHMLDAINQIESYTSDIPPLKARISAILGSPDAAVTV